MNVVLKGQIKPILNISCNVSLSQNFTYFDIIFFSCKSATSSISESHVKKTLSFSRSHMHRPSSKPLIYDVREFRNGKALKNLLQLNRTLKKGERGLCYLLDYTYQTLTHVFNEPAPWKFLESVSAVLIRWRWSDHVGRGLDWWLQEKIFTDWTDAIQRLSTEFSMRLSIFRVSFFLLFLVSIFIWVLQPFSFYRLCQHLGVYYGRDSQVSST